ncbi:hypothetical protein ZWY2020_026145 [Hordeum vulgare]|nr:hypothetical protein ZWY2020_026145 [Hordeum vulgare]
MATEAFEMYRQSEIGYALTATLDEMVSAGVLSPDLAITVLLQFDKSMGHALDKHAKTGPSSRDRGQRREGSMADAFDMYRRSVIGVALLETLNEMVDCGKLSLDLAINVLLQFDKSMSHALDKHVTSRATFKVPTKLPYCTVFLLRQSLAYRYYDSVWTLNLRNTTFKNEEIEVVLPKVMIVACDMRLIAEPEEPITCQQCL